MILEKYQKTNLCAEGLGGLFFENRHLPEKYTNFSVDLTFTCAFRNTYFVVSIHRGIDQMTQNMQNLENKVAVVLGGTGGVGEGIVRTLLQAGATVVVPSRNDFKLQRLQEYVADVAQGQLVPYVGSVNTEESALALGEYLQQNFKNIDIAVASLGGWHQGYPLYSYPLQDWNRIVNDNLTSHFLAIKTLVPLLHPSDGTYFHINGFSAEQPYAMAGPVAMTAAAQKSLILTLSQEVSRTGIRVYELILGPMKTRDRLRHGHGQDDWLFPEEVGNYLIEQRETERQHEVVHYLLSKKQGS
jgi:NAD(P)-dependent dehydrogenase (short-subunit alcohol dehydrogenase family)